MNISIRFHTCVTLFKIDPKTFLIIQKRIKMKDTKAMQNCHTWEVLTVFKKAIWIPEENNYMRRNNLLWTN